MTTRDLLAGVGVILMLGVLTGIAAWRGENIPILLIGGVLLFGAVVHFQSWQALREKQKRLKAKK